MPRVGGHWRMPDVQGQRAVRHVIIDTEHCRSSVRECLLTGMGGRGGGSGPVRERAGVAPGAAGTCQLLVCVKVTHSCPQGLPFGRATSTEAGTPMPSPSGTLSGTTCPP